MKKNLNLILIIIWMIIIFVLSSFDATDSGNQSGTIVNFIGSIFHISDIDMLSFIIRKIAHISEYLILGLLVANYFKNILSKYVFISFGVCVLYSISDEFHQLFIPGRSGQVTDVLIDMIGIVLGIIIIYLFNRKKA